jgi:hypothetical protein
MSVLGEIHAAIEKLTELKAESTPGVWTILDGGDRFIAEGGPLGDGQFEYIVTEPIEFRREADCDLIEVLHRTIDAQLAILRHVAEHYRGDLGIGTNRYVVALARAINGEGTE